MRTQCHIGMLQFGPDYTVIIDTDWNIFNCVVTIICIWGGWLNLYVNNNRLNYNEHIGLVVSTL